MNNSLSNIINTVPFLVAGTGIIAYGIYLKNQKESKIDNEDKSTSTDDLPTDNNEPSIDTSSPKPADVPTHGKED